MKEKADHRNNDFTRKSGERGRIKGSKKAETKN